MDDIERLVIIEDLRRLMARYVYNADHQRWDELADLFTPDATFIPLGVDGSVQQQFTGREEIATKIPGGMSAARAVLVHHLFSSEIDVASSTSAAGVWSMEDLVTLEPSGGAAMPFKSMHGFGHYRLKFAKVTDRWLISELVISRLRMDFVA